ncbi:unnamed protein product [Calypogeia fissa]
MDSAVKQKAKTSAVKAVLGDIFTGAKSQNVDLLSGNLLLSKKSILDVIDVGAELVDTAFDLLELNITVQLVSVDLDPSTKEPKLSAKSRVKRVPLTDLRASPESGDEQYAVTFEVPKDFGEVGAFYIWNPHLNKFYLHYVTLVLPDETTIQFPCNSWVFNEGYYPKPRVFFSNKVYLPAATPPGLQDLRESELILLRGNDKGMRKDPDRIYDYDVYNDLGDPDLIPSTRRPPLGGSKELPYPRRIRTGRPHSISDPESEVGLPAFPDFTYFVPPDERFSREKGSGFLATGVKSILHGLRPLISAAFEGNNWDSFEEIEALFKHGLDLQKPAEENPTSTQDFTKSFVFLDTLFDADGQDKSLLNFPLPQLIAVDDKAWMTDEEYGRQILAGIHPVVIALLKEFPPKSSLDPKVYGQGTALTEEHIKPYLEGKTVAEAIAAKRLFTIDYHDAFLPYINRINALGNKGYAPRSIFYYTDDGKMMPVAIELSLPPPAAGGEAVNKVFTPPISPEADDHTWMLAKLHATATDSNYHEVYSHFVRSHATMETIVIASNRQLSRMHPIFSFLLPLFKNTMMINSVAREILINGDGIVELVSTPGKYSMELSSKVYGALWRFDQESLPEDLIARGMAEQVGDTSNPGGVKLVIEDYPFALDALEMWDAMKAYTTKYVNIAYKDSGSDKGVQSDIELQTWWNEIINVGHGDKKDEPWWPKLDSIVNLVNVLTTIWWVAGPHHASTNFGQYAYSGFYANKPSQTRRLIPEKGTKEYDELQASPEKFWLSSISSRINSTLLMVVFELLSSHSVDEEYVGQRLEDNWTSDPQVQDAFAEFSASMKNIEHKQSDRNKDPKLPNRRWPAQVPYTLLFPSSPSGLTGRGVPNSTSI